MMSNQYMSKDELKELFEKEDLHVTKAVAILLKQAVRYTTRVKNLQDKSQLEACENTSVRPLKLLTWRKNSIGDCLKTRRIISTN